MGNHLMVGGQAVIEGVMMRGPKLTATAVRDPNGKIQVETKDVNSISDRYPILKKPMLRGTVSLIESLVIGIRSLSYSAKMAGEEDEQQDHDGTNGHRRLLGEDARRQCRAMGAATLFKRAQPTGSADRERYSGLLP